MARDVQALFSLQGQTAVVTGGSRGLGWQIAQALGEAGARVLLAARKADELEVACARLQQQGIAASWLATDCADEAQLQRLADTAMRELGQVDILVNNAGAVWAAAAEAHPLEAWDKVFNLNVRGYFILSQRIARASMIPQQAGSIINVASIGGLGGNPPHLRTIAYNTSKGAVVNFTRALAAEWGRHGIRVNAICPGFFPSKMTRATLESLGSEQLAQDAPLQRLGDDEDLKGAVVLFASAAGKHITGQALAIDGGVSIVTGG